MDAPKNRIVYILLALFVGTLGLHNFYAGYTKKAVIQLILGISCILTFVSAIWALIDIFTVTSDAQGVPFQS